MIKNLLTKIKFPSLSKFLFCFTIDDKGSSTSITKNKKLEDTLANRQWGVNTMRKMNFITGFECHVCDQIHRNRKRVRDEGKPPVQHRATREHYGCPKPTRFPFPDIEGSNSWERNNWEWDYENGRKMADKLKLKLNQ